MRSRRQSGAVKLALVLSLLANGAVGYWVWYHTSGSTASSSANGQAAGVKTPSAKRSWGGTRQASAAEPDSPSALRIRLDGGRGSYYLGIRSLDVAADPQASPEEDSPGDHAGPPPGAWREIASLSCCRGGPGGVKFDQKPIGADEDSGGVGDNVGCGCCRIALVADDEAGGSISAVTPVSGTYHETYMPVADRQWDNNRLPLWRYQTADGHGGKFHYEVFLGKRAKG